MSFQPGHTIRHYRIEEKIGEGGMGIVYLAEDTRLGRRVALKVLSAELSIDADRRARFEREARAVAALNHPNIVTIHSVEEADGICFLTMELVSGQSLTHVMTRGGLPLGRLLELGLGIAEALVEAHRQGVVHRDLKPDNIMVTAEGRIKILDFGLAKLRESTLERPGTVLPTKSITEEGRIVGTVSYMSPEQAQGKPLDHRSDIFSFGVVLYEMATGQKPFQGDTAISTISSILKDTPAPPQQLNGSVPPQLGRIVRRCLSKEVDRRYQSTDDLRNELREVKEESESGELSVETAAAAAAPSSTRRALLWGTAAGVVLFALGAAWLVGQREGPSGPSPGPGATLAGTMQMSRATTDGRVQEAAISPDGRYLAYVRQEAARYSLQLRQVVTGDEVQVVPPSPSLLGSPSFSADGNYLYYVSASPGHLSGSANRVSVLGGAPRRILDGVFSVQPSPDGSKIAFTGGTSEEQFVRVTGSDGMDPHELATRKGRDHFDSDADWSRDGKTLAVVSHRFGEPQQVVLIDVASGEERPFPIPSLRNVMDLTWLPGGEGLIAAGSDSPVNQRGSNQIWRVSLDGKLEPLTRDLNSYLQLTATSEGSTVAAVQVEYRSGIEIAPVKDGIPGTFTELFPISASRAGGAGVTWLDGTRLAHTMQQGEIPQIFVTDTGTRSTRPLTSGSAHELPSVSRDGRTMAVVRSEGDQNHIWRLDPDSGREERLTGGPFDGFPLVSPDGQWVVYSVLAENRRIMKMPAAGGAPVALTEKPTAGFSISPDGREVFGFEFGGAEEFSATLTPLAGGAARPVPGLPIAVSVVRFHPSGRALDYLISHDGADELWSLPLGGGPAKRLARFEGKEVGDFVWSPDGSRLAIVKRSRSGDVVLLKHARS